MLSVTAIFMRLRRPRLCLRGKVHVYSLSENVRVAPTIQCDIEKNQCLEEAKMSTNDEGQDNQVQK